MRHNTPDDATLMHFPGSTGDGLTSTAARGADAVDDAIPDIPGSAESSVATSGSPDAPSAADASPAAEASPAADAASAFRLPGDEAPLATGERVGPYEVREHIGDGGMASVYRAWHTGLHRFEALKIPRQQGRYGPEAAFVRRLLAEARTVAGLHHPHIALIHAVSEADSPLQYFAMELVDGGDLAQMIQSRGKLAPEEALPILRQVAEALDYAHASGVVHRDIKPANILLTPEGTAKVVDFGISRAGEEVGGTRLTRSGMIVGTPEYMSPEQSGSGAPVTHRTDIYSLGVVAYEMLCGTPPFVAGEGVNRLSILMKHLGEAPASPLRSVPGFGPAATDALLTALAKKPEDRFGTCSEFVAALTRALQKRGHTQLLVASGSPVVMDGAARPITRSLSERTAETLPPPEADGAAKRTLPIVRPARRRRPGALVTAVSVVALCVLALLGWWQRNATQTINVFVATSTPVLNPALVPTTAPPAVAPVSKTTRTVSRRTPIPFKRVTRNTPTLAQGATRIVRQGRDGARLTTYRITTEGQRELARTVVSQRIVQAPVDQITELGTRVRTASPPPARPRPVVRKRPAVRVRPARRAATAATPPRRTTPRRPAVRRPVSQRPIARRPAVRRPVVRRPVVRRRTRPAPTRRTRPRPAPRRSTSGEAPLPP